MIHRTKVSKYRLALFRYPEPLASTISYVSEREVPNVWMIYQKRSCARGGEKIGHGVVNEGRRLRYILLSLH